MRIQIVLLIHLLRTFLQIQILIGTLWNQRDTGGLLLQRVAAIGWQPFRSDSLVLVVIAFQEGQVEVQWLRLLRGPLE